MSLSELSSNWIVPVIIGGVVIAGSIWFFSAPPPKFGIHNRQQLVARLSSDDSDAFVGELIQQIREEQPSPQLVECFLENIVLVMPDHARLALVKKLISEEVKHTEATLFRSNALAAKAMTKIAKQVGQDYLEELLGDFVKDLFEKDEDMEVFPTRSGEVDENTLEENAKNVERAFATFFKRLVESIPKIPWQIKLMINELFKESVKRFPNSSQTVIGGFLLLRFICPAIVLPSNLKVQRGLITIAKILQNISNKTKWNSKEVHMIRFNHMVDDYLPEWNGVLDSLCKEVSVPADTRRTAKPVTAPEYDSIEKDLSFFTK